jgi:hypothetical protein
MASGSTSQHNQTLHQNCVPTDILGRALLASGVACYRNEDDTNFRVDLPNASSFQNLIRRDLRTSTVPSVMGYSYE